MKLSEAQSEYLDTIKDSDSSEFDKRQAIKNCDYAEVMVEAIDTFCVDDINIEWYNFFYKLPAKLIGRAEISNFEIK